jgi:hypothetical protein
MLKKVLALLVAILVFSQVSKSETLNFNQCKTFYQMNQSSNETSYYPVEVCSPEFPRINQNIVLDYNNSIYLLPDYNLSVRLSEDVFKLQTSQVLQNMKDIQDLNKRIDDLEKRIDGLNNYINQQIGLVSSEIQNQTSSFNQQIIEIQNVLRKPQGFGFEWVLALVVFVGLIIGYFGIKSGMIKLPRYKAPEYQTIEPSEVEKKKMKERLYKKP